MRVVACIPCAVWNGNKRSNRQETFAELNVHEMARARGATRTGAPGARTQYSEMRGTGACCHARRRQPCEMPTNEGRSGGEEAAGGELWCA